MRDRRLYERILGLPEPWRVSDVQLHVEATEVIVQVAMRGQPELVCPDCGETMSGYDHRRLEAAARLPQVPTCLLLSTLESQAPKCPPKRGNSIERYGLDSED